MAPDVAGESLAHLPTGSRVIDPMCGSGSVLRACVERGLTCTGMDIDPLAVLMARVWTSDLDADAFLERAAAAVKAAKSLSDADVQLPDDRETAEFLDFWFAPLQKAQLARMFVVLAHEDDLAMRDALRIALSRTIVTKDKGASRARDVSHSRPHRVWIDNDFDVYPAFVVSARQLASRLSPEKITGAATVALGDARQLTDVNDDSFDAAVTSPPYLNAIDYMRGHRMTLPWLGYDVAGLRVIRASSIGAERRLDDEHVAVEDFITQPESSTLKEVHIGWVRRYAQDLHQVLTELRRVVRRSGRITIVVGNSVIRGAYIDNAALIESLADFLELSSVGRRDREIPARRRYLPPPGDGEGFLNARMRQETVLTFECS